MEIKRRELTEPFGILGGRVPASKVKSASMQKGKILVAIHIEDGSLNIFDYYKLWRTHYGGKSKPHLTTEPQQINA